MTNKHWMRLKAKYSYDPRTGIICNKRTGKQLDYKVNGIYQLQVMVDGDRKTVTGMAFAYYIMTEKANPPRLMPKDGNYSNLKWKNIELWEPQWVIEEREMLARWNKR